MRTTKASLFISCLAVSACMHERIDLTEPEGPVAHDASEAWPDAPANVPALGPDDLLRACATAGVCSPEVMQYDVGTRIGLVEMCVSDLVFSAERSIPMSGWSARNERAEYWVSCVLQNENDCAAVNQCATERHPSIVCQEDGCSSSEDFAVSCNGSVATLQGATGSFNRDCARAFASCDPSSPTGCTDRHFTSCPTEASKKDRCDGDVRLGCDGFDQVSYRDCSRLGGSCAAAADGSQDCVYPSPVSPECGENPLPAGCDAATLSVCVLGVRVAIPTPICGSA